MRVSRFTRPSLIALTLGVFALVALSHRSTVLSLPANDVADHVLGQAGSFNTNGCNLGGAGVSASSLCLLNQGEAVFDPAGNLYVADTSNNRVLGFDTPLTGDKVADRVFGQGGSFASNGCNVGGVTASTLCAPTDVALDGAGNLYVVDANNHRVLEYNAPFTDTVADAVFGKGGSFTTQTCNTGGISANSLCFTGDTGARGALAIDAAGNVWITDYANHRVLGFSTPLSTDTTADIVFGQGGSFTAAVCDNGGVSASSLCNPMGIALDGGGNLYVADTAKNRVLEYETPLTTDTTADRVFGQAGSFTSGVCNNGGASASTLCLLNQRAGIAVDALGNLYIADQANGRVLEFDAPRTTDVIADRVFGTAGTFSESVCNQNGIGAGSLCVPVGLAVDTAGNLAVADAGNNRIVVYNDPLKPGVPADAVLGHGGVFTSGACDDGGISASSLCTDGNHGGVAVDTAGNVYVADYNKHRILQYNTPLTTDMIADRVFGQNGSFTAGLCNQGGSISAGSLCQPSGLAVDGVGNLYAVDAGNNRVLVYNTPLTTDTVADVVFGQNGSFFTTACNVRSASSLCFSQGGTPARGDVALDAAGNLYIADYAAFRVLEYDTPLVNGVVADRVFGQDGSFGTPTCNLGGISASSLCLPSGVAVDSAGNLYVVDSANNRVLEFHTPLSADTVADSVFGQAGDFTSATCDKGGLSAASLCFAVFGSDRRGDVAVDSTGNVFVAEGTRNRLLEYDTPLSSDVVADRVYGHVSQNYQSGSCNDGGVTRYALCAPLGVTFGPDKSLFVLDGVNNRVLAFAAGADVDADGCSDVEEFSSNEFAGGKRDPDNRWDFYDVNGSKKVDASDIGLVRSHFNQTPAHPSYEDIYDRRPGAAPWAPGPPNGIVNAIDIGLVRAEFNHNCQAAP